MYNLFVTSEKGRWNKNAYKYERSRVFSHTDEKLKSKFKGLTEDSICDLMMFPCLFMYENQNKLGARLGWLTGIRPDQYDVWVDYKIEKGIREIKYKTLADHYLELGIDESTWEKDNTHWGLKDIELPQVLHKAKVITGSAAKKMDPHHLLSPVIDLKGGSGSRNIKVAFEKARKRLQDDPAGAITSARTLLEAVFKGVLDGKKVSYNPGIELSDLYQMTARELDFAPSEDTEPTLKKIMRGCVSAVEGIGTLRNKLGDAHDHGAVSVRADKRHARFVVNMAFGLATYIWESYEVKKHR